MGTYAKGQRAEHWLLKEIKQDPDCLEIVRCSRSIGSFDLCAIMKDDVWLIQVKTHWSIKSEERLSLQRLAQHQTLRTAWFVIVTGDTCEWQMYMPKHCPAAEEGWYLYPDGPYGKIGDRIKTRSAK